MPASACCWETPTAASWPPAIGTPLYNSVYRFDDEMLVNVHAYGILAAYTPTMHLRRVDGAFFNTYLESFERVWASARVPIWWKGDS